jgi:hypothetical protein
MADIREGSQMADSKKSALDFLLDLRQERDELDALIQAVEKRLGETQVQPISGSDGEIESRTAPRRKIRFVPGSMREVASSPALTVGFFHNMSQAAATEKLMKMNPGQALTTGQILETFRNSGMPLNPKNSVQILYTALKRNPKFERVGNKAWGLREWYPEKKKRTNSDRLLPDPDNLPDHHPLLDEDESEENKTRKRNPA